MTFRSIMIQTMLAMLVVAPACIAAPVFSRGSSRPEGTAEIIEKIRQYPSDKGLLIKLKENLGKEDDLELQQQSMAIISLAMMLHNEMEIGFRARNALLKRYPESVYGEALAIPNLGVACPNCGGEGRIVRACPICAGTGECQMCQGDGVLEMKLAQGENTVCPKCGGSGQCTECSGSGRKYRKCHKCNGRGLILDKQRIRRAYEAVLSGHPEKLEPRDETIMESKPKDGKEDDEDVLRYF